MNTRCVVNIWQKYSLQNFSHFFFFPPQEQERGSLDVQFNLVLSEIAELVGMRGEDLESYLSEAINSFHKPELVKEEDFHGGWIWEFVRKCKKKFVKRNKELYQCK